MDGFLDFCQQCAEIKLYLTIDNLGGAIFGINHNLADGRPTCSNPEETLCRLQEKIEIAVNQVVRFGVEHPHVDGAASPEYWAWFRNWNSYIESLSYEEKEQLEKDLNNEGDLTKWQPAMTWQDALEASKKYPFPTAEQIQSHLSIYPQGKAFSRFCLLVDKDSLRTGDCGAYDIGLTFYWAYCDLKKEERRVTEKTKSAILALIDALFPENKPFATAAKNAYLHQHLK